MTTYAIGDLHGCLSPLQRLLDKLRFDPRLDHLWFVGDLVNRGPQSLATLRFVRDLGSSATVVLGNHDLHLLAVANGVRNSSPKDTFERILAASDRDELLHWLRHRPFLHHDESLGFLMVHAGIHPSWDLATARTLADELEGVLRSPRHVRFLERMYGNTPDHWPAPKAEKLKKHDRRRLAVNVFTRMRFCTTLGDLDFSFNGPPARAPSRLRPWHHLPGRVFDQTRVVFGHWSSHPAMSHPKVVPTDRGCVWGGMLTAFDLQANCSHTVHKESRIGTAERDVQTVW